MIRAEIGLKNRQILSETYSSPMEGSVLSFLKAE
jgi:hypothetical protein